MQGKAKLKRARTGSTTLSSVDEIFIKTPEGKEEMVNRDHDLSFVQRRILILIDGVKPVSMLRSFTQPAEFNSVISTLLDKKLIINIKDVKAENKSLATIAQIPPIVAVEHVDPSSFAWIQAETIRFLTEVLKDDGIPIREAVVKTKDMNELKKLMRGIIIFVEKRMGEEVTVKLARHFNAMVLLSPKTMG